MMLEKFIKFMGCMENKRYHCGDQEQRTVLADMRPGFVDFFC